jgi:hypothetical protein
MVTQGWALSVIGVAVLLPHCRSAFRVRRIDLVVGGLKEAQTARMEFQSLPARPPFAVDP